MRETIDVPNTARALALGRVLVAAFVLYLSTSDPGEMGLRLEIDDLTAMLYAAAAIALAIVAARSWWWDFRLTVAAVAVDFAAFIVIPQYIDPVTSGFLAAATAIAVLIILNSLIRFGRPTALRAAILVNVICYGICVLRHFGFYGPPMVMDGGALMMPGAMPLSGHHDLWSDLRHLLFLTLTTITIVWFSRWTAFQPRALWPELISAPALEELLAEVLAKAQKLAGANGGTLCWRGGVKGECIAVSCGPDGSRGRWANLPCGIGDDAEQRHLLFDVAGNHALELNAEAPIAIYRGSIAADEFLTRSGNSSGLALSLSGLSGNGRLILSGFPDLHVDLLRLSPTLARYVAHCVDNYEYDRIGRIVALSGVRGAIARDLHDSVAQSLAGASYWLRGLMMAPGLEQRAVGEIGEAVQSLEAESAEIRQVISRLRAEAVQDEPLDVNAEVARELEVQSRRWRIECDLTPIAEPLVAGELVVYEIRQILREAAGNAVRHGDAANVAVRIGRVPGNVQLTITDDGSGFPVGTDGVIPLSLAERAKALGGRVVIDNKGPGAVISVFLPGALFR